MAEYIEREKVWRKVNRADSIEKALDEIDKIPAADVVKVQHGEWKPYIDWEYDYHCSVCNGSAGRGDYGNYDVLTDYCPNCGAKMDGKGEGCENADR